MKPGRRISSRSKDDARSGEITRDPEKSAGSKWTVPIVATLLAGFISLSVTYWQMKIAERNENERQRIAEKIENDKYRRILLENFYNDSMQTLIKIDLLFKKACDVRKFEDDATLVDLLSTYWARYQRFKDQLDGDIINTLDLYATVVSERWLRFSEGVVDPSKKKGWYNESHTVYLRAKEALTKLIPMLS